MKRKKIKSKHISAETPGITCGDCGGGCFDIEEGNAYNWIGTAYYCEWCGQEWEFPEGVYLKVVYAKRPH
tara:strand:+ start:233 stop:442 length:210 start_codon:yes stop_codon:yes gene_type:complete